MKVCAGLQRFTNITQDYLDLQKVAKIREEVAKTLRRFVKDHIYLGMFTKVHGRLLKSFHVRESQ